MILLVNGGGTREGREVNHKLGYGKPAFRVNTRPVRLGKAWGNGESILQLRNFLSQSLRTLLDRLEGFVVSGQNPNLTSVRGRS